jgi:hypothetical protein
MEIQLSHVSAGTITEYFNDMEHILNGISSEFVWNMDEIGHADWADAPPDKGHVPHDYMDVTVPIGIGRTGQRITLIGCICADESYTKPMMIILRHTIDADLALYGGSDRICHICHHPKGFVDREVFEWWLGQIFVPAIEQRGNSSLRSRLLIFDGCGAHEGDFSLDLCMEHDIISFLIPLHSSNQVQPLDLCVFGVTKGLMARLNKSGEGTGQSVHIAKLVFAFHSTCRPVNMIASFRNAGIISPLEQTGIPVCYIDKKQCRCLLYLFEAPIATADVETE